MEQNKTLTVDRQFRKLEDLDLIDNFLFQEMLSQEEGEDFPIYKRESWKV